MKKMILTVAAVLLGVSLFAYDIAAVAELKGGVKSVTRTDFAIVSKFGLVVLLFLLSGRVVLKHFHDLCLRDIDYHIVDGSLVH